MTQNLAGPVATGAGRPQHITEEKPMGNAKLAAWRWQDGNNAVTATWRSGGWPRQADEPNGRTEPCRSTLGRRAAGLGPCRLPAEWKVERKVGRSVRTAWYCVRDLPSTEAPPVDAEEIV